MFKFIVRVLANTVALYLAAYFIPGIEYKGGWTTLIIVGVAWSLINLIVKPILTLLSLPLVILSLGLFILVLNTFLFWAMAFFLPQFEVSGFLPACLTVILISLVNFIIFKLLK